MYLDTFTPDILGSDKDGSVGSINDFTSYAGEDKIVWEPIVITNNSNSNLSVNLVPDIRYETVNVNGDKVVYSWKDTVQNVYHTAATPHETVTIDMGVFELPPGATRFLLDDNDKLRITSWEAANTDALLQHADSVTTVNANTNRIDWKPGQNVVNIIRFQSRFIVEENSSGLRWATDYRTDQHVKLTNKSTGKIYEYDFTSSIYNIPDIPLGVYDYEYTVTKPLSNVTIDMSETRRGTINHRTNFTRSDNYFWGGDSIYLYAPISVNLFYDFDNDGVQDLNEPTINDDTETKNVRLSPYTTNGYNTDMFVNNNPSSKKVDEAGESYATYTGDKYSVTGAQAGVKITYSNIANGDTVSVNAPVFVYATPTINVVYDIDRNDSVSSSDHKPNGTLEIGGVKYNVVNGRTTIPKIKSGSYTFTFSDTLNGNVEKGTILITPEGTPAPDGSIVYTTSLLFDIDTDKTAQVYVDTTHNGVYSDGTTKVNNKVVIE